MDIQDDVPKNYSYGLFTGRKIEDEGFEDLVTHSINDKEIIK